MRYWISNLVKEAINYLQMKHVSLESAREGYEDKKDVEASLDCVTRSIRSTYFDCNDSSQSFFWRWDDFCATAGDGLQLRTITNLLTNKEVVTFSCGEFF